MGLGGQGVGGRGRDGGTEDVCGADAETHEVVKSSSMAVGTIRSDSYLCRGSMVYSEAQSLASKIAPVILPVSRENRNTMHSPTTDHFGRWYALYYVERFSTSAPSKR